LRSKLNRLSILAVAIITMPGMLMGSCNTGDNQVPPLSLQIIYPDDGIAISTNLLKVRGKVLPSDAIVRINGTQANVNHEDSTFYSYIELDEGGNEIEVTAVRGNESTTEVLSVSFEPVPWIDYEWPDLKEGVDYTKTPVHISGTVSDPNASVVLYTTSDPESGVPPDAVKATVNGDSFEADVLLKTGANYVTARVEKEGLTNTRTMSVSVTEDGDVIYITGKSDGTSLALPCAYLENIDSDFSIGAGETRLYDIKLKTTPYPHTAPRQECIFGFRLVDAPPDSQPNGITASIEPPVLLAYQNTNYDVTMVIETSEKVVPGTYHLRLRMTPVSGEYNGLNTIIEVTVVE
jgi:hypothetical protein